MGYNQTPIQDYTSVLEKDLTLVILGKTAKTLSTSLI